MNHTINEDHAFSETYKEISSEVNENVDINHAVEQASVKQSFYHCCHCLKFFSSKNSLHKHIRFSHNSDNIKASWVFTSEPELKSAYFNILSEELVQSSATNTSVKGYRFQGWCYITVQAKLSQNSQTVSICLNTDCTASLIDWGFLREYAPNTEVKKMASSLKVQGLSFSSHSAEDYVKLELYLSANYDKTAVIHWEIHIIDDLKVNILVRTDILVSEQIDILLSQRKAVIRSCRNIELDLNVTTLLNQTNRLLLLNDQITVSVYDSIIVQIKPLQDLLTDQDLLFESECKLADVYVYISIVDHTLTSIEVCNNFSKAVIISHHTPLSRIVEYKADSCFLISSDLLL